jgi:hypothetical protein
MPSPLRSSRRRPRIRPRRLLRAEQLESRSLLAAVITVNSTLDTDERDTVLTLREAIEVSNRTLTVGELTTQEKAQVVGNPTQTDTDSIHFNLPGAGPQTIRPDSELPPISDPVIIDGYTQPGAKANTNGPGLGSNAVILVQLSGANIFGFGAGLSLFADNSTVTGLAVNQFPDGIDLLGGSGNSIQGNFIGTDATGTLAQGNSQYGVFVQDSANNIIGGLTPASRNVISSNLTGVGISSLSPGNLIQGNLIGTDASGTLPLGNTIEGVGTFFDTFDVFIGGTTAAARNVISGNGTGVSVFADSIDIQGNFIGTDVTGALPLGNSFGIQFGQSDGGVVGGLAAGAGNVISGNLSAGIQFFASSSHMIQGNLIGVAANGSSSLGNGQYGILIQADEVEPASSNNLIQQNVIAFNGTDQPGAGIAIDHQEPRRNTGNSILQNSIFSNAGLGIDLNDDGPTANDLLPTADADVGSNNLQNFPVLNSASLVPGITLTLQYSVPSTTSNSSYPLHIEFFKADSTGQGQTFLGADTYLDSQAQTTATISFTPPVPLVGGDKIVATATDDSGNTSEFSASIVIPNPTCSTDVVNVSDTGPGSLRQAIDCANIRAGLDTIAFNIPGAGVHTISPTTALPTITDPVTIDGYTQPGAAPNTNAIDDPDPLKRGMTGTLLIQLSGPAGGTPAMSGLVITTSDSTVRGLVINGFANNGIAINGGDDNVIVGNYIGTDPTGMSAIGNGKWGVLINAGSADNRVGTDGDGAGDAAERNLIGGSGFGGIGITGAGADHNVVAGNLVGTNASGTAALGNANRGVDIFNGAQQNRIGTKGDGVHDGAERNILSGNGWDGVGIDGAGTSNNFVAGNYIGADISGTSPIGNVLHGATIFGGAAGNLIVGNKIAFNQQNGVTVTNPASLENAILRNSIFSNAGLGIDLGNDGATANDIGDVDLGANQKQNFPAISHATKTSGQLKLTYIVPSDPANSTYPILVEFFQADADGQEGKVFVGFDIFTPSDFSAGGKTVTFAAASPIKVFDKIVATATDSLPGSVGFANTSEFSTSSTIASPWINPRNRLDVNDDTHVAPNDVVAVVNFINGFKSGPVPDDADNAQPFLDVNGDNNVAPNDALDIINAINAGQASEGEAAADGPSDRAALDDVINFLAFDAASQSPQRRRG